MKKQLTAVLLLFAFLLTAAGCSAANMERKLDTAEERVEEKLDAAEDSLERTVRRAAVPAATVPSVPSAVEDTTVTQTQAENIALESVGLTAAQVTGLRTEYEIDDGVPQYDVEFHSGDWEYEFEISARDGSILSRDKDSRHD